jgi:ribosomal-protein-alanine N-acetyltransferase
MLDGGLEIDTERLRIRRPEHQHLAALYAIASDVEVTRYVGWPRHRSLDDTRAFLDWSDSEWQRRGRGPQAIFDRSSGELIGTTGLAIETPWRASTGYVFLQSAWGRGFATEALAAMVDDACEFGVRRLYALCHTDHRASWRVLEKGGFTREATLESYQVFPNLPNQKDQPGPVDAYCYTRIF